MWGGAHPPVGESRNQQGEYDKERELIPLKGPETACRLEGHRLVQVKLVRAVLNRVGKLLGIGVQWGTDLDTRASQVVDDDRVGSR
jgi:hypothetical protein